jgi:hypothetical protein
MSHQFSGNLGKPASSNPNSSGIEFYNTKKDTSHSIMLSQHTQSSNALSNSQPLSKFQTTNEFHFKPTPINQIKSKHETIKNSSLTNFLKSANEHGGSKKQIPGETGNSVTSSAISSKTLNSGIGTSTISSFMSPSHNKSMNSDIIKSSIKDMIGRNFKKEG